ncbi:uncharacterized protein DC041_0011432, partial [Schistosoma bovis]
MSVTQPFTLQDTGRETSTIYMHLQLLALLPGQRQNPSGHDNTNIKRSLSLNKNCTDNTIPTEKPAESPTGNPEMVVRNRFPDDNDIISSTESLSTTNFDNQSVQPIRQVMTSNSIQQISNSSLGRIRLTIQFHCLSNYLEVTVHECHFQFPIEADHLPLTILRLDIKNHVGRFTRSGKTHFIGTLSINLIDSVDGKADTK